MSTPHDPTTGVPTCYRHPGRESYIRCQRCGKVICPDCMNDAAVGFQCPGCIAEGAKTTRSGRTAYGGLRPTDASRTSMVLIVLNAAVWLGITLTGGSGSRLVDLLALRPSGLCQTAAGFFSGPQAACTGTWLPGATDGAYWQLLTSGFTHVSLLHIGFNMFALYALGPQLETALGRSRFLALYFLSLIAASTLVMWAAPQYQATLGASGAIYGLFAALLVIARKVGGDLRQLLILVGVNLVITFAIPGISWQGHLGGFVGGAVITAILIYAPRGPRRTTFQVLGLSALTLALVAALLVRIFVLA